MGLDVYLPIDIERGIKAALIMCVATYAANGGSNVEHAAGVLDYAQAQAALYGLSWTAIVQRCKEDLSAGARALLDDALWYRSSAKASTRPGIPGPRMYSGRLTNPR
jgi:hypothetical protein